MTDDLDWNANRFLDLDDDVLVGQCMVDCYRSQGPGGQKRNKTSSAVRLRHQPTGLVATAVEDRSQHVNKARAIKRLRLTIALTLRQTISLVDFSPSELLSECIDKQSRLQVGLRDHRYNHVVAEILDILHACDMRVSEAAKQIGISTGRLTSFLQRNPKLFGKVNEMRVAVGTKPLRHG